MIYVRVGHDYPSNVLNGIPDRGKRCFQVLLRPFIVRGNVYERGHGLRAKIRVYAFYAD